MILESVLRDVHGKNIELKDMDYQAGQRVLMSGNEAIARGAVEAGVGFCSSYPGTPATEIASTLMKWARDTGMYVEWSTNEKVALEAAAAASWAGVPAMCSMKSLGLNVAADFLLNVNLSGTGTGGLVLVVCDDPRGHSSSNEQDSRFYAKAAKIPLLEPATAQQAKDIIPYAFSLSKRMGIPVMVRSTTRLSHTQAMVSLGAPSELQITIEETLPRHLFNVPDPHLRNRDLQEKLRRIAREFATSQWNLLPPDGGDSPLTVVSSGISQLYVREALREVDAQKVRHFGVVTTFPLPSELVERVMADNKEALFVEEVDPFLEDEFRIQATYGTPMDIVFHGKHDGFVPSWGELNTDIIAQSLRRLRGMPSEIDGERERAREHASSLLIPRPLTFCAGCTHRNVYWALRKVRKRLDGNLVVTGDIGCYSLGVFYDQAMDTMQAMGSGIGTASGLGQLSRFGHKARVATIAGDSTFFHACLPGLVNARHTNADVLFIIVDNKTTAMTGFQPHPGSDDDEGHRLVSLRKMVEAVEPDMLSVVDGDDIPALIEAFHTSVKERGLKVVIVDSHCRLREGRLEDKSDLLQRVVIDEDMCRGEKCGICVKQYSCVALAWDSERERPVMVEDQCVRCGACIDVCPYGAIRRAR